MTKYASVILALVCATVGIGAADAQQSRVNSSVRIATISGDYRTELPERPDMQPRDGKYSWCDDSGGGLICGIAGCDEFDEDWASSCYLDWWNQSDGEYND